MDLVRNTGLAILTIVVGLALVGSATAQEKKDEAFEAYEHDNPR